jgi:SulP family sulfate permease
MIAIIEAYKSGLLQLKNIKKNIVPGIIVGIVALPLAMAFAIASGVKPEQGIYTAIIAGLIIGLFGGTRTQISGPTGAFVVILASITAQYGVSGLQIATIMAGCILCVMGKLKIGNLIKIIPYPVIVGFTSGIGVIIFVSQWKDFFGLSVTIPIDASFHQKLGLLVNAFSGLDLKTTILSLFSLLILIFIPKYIKKIPSPLVAMIFATFIQYYFGFSSIATIGSVFGEIPQKLPTWALPDLSQLRIVDLIIPAFSIAFLGAIESLLSAATADSLTGTKHHANQELMGQGYANIVAPFFGGFASTGAIARTVTNIKQGGNSPIAAIVHALVLILILVVFSPYAIYIPLAVLSAILFMVAYSMSDIPEFLTIVKRAPWYDVLVLIITFLLTILLDLVSAVATGVICAAIFFVLRTHQTTKLNKQNVKDIIKNLITPKIHTSFLLDGIVYTIEGPFFFGVSEKIEQALTMTSVNPTFVVFKLSNVPFIDMTGLATLSKVMKTFQAKGIKVYLCDVNKNVSQKITRVGILEMIQTATIFATLEDITKRQADVA